MARYYYFFLVFCLSLSGASQNLTVQVKRNCDEGKSTELINAIGKFNRVFDDLVDEGQVINATANLNGLTHREYFVLDSESKFDAVYKEYTKRISSSFPEEYKLLTTTCRVRKDTIIHRAKLYPVIKSDFWSYAEPVKHVDVAPDPTLNYNVVFDFTEVSIDEDNDKIDSARLNSGLAEIGRIYNMHVAAGIPKNKINFVLAIHAYAINSFLSNDEYRKKFKTDNPNLRIIKELSDAGVRFETCGQAMNRFKIEKSMLVPHASVVLTSQTSLTQYQIKGFAIIPMKND